MHAFCDLEQWAGNSKPICASEACVDPRTGQPSASALGTWSLFAAGAAGSALVTDPHTDTRPGQSHLGGEAIYVAETQSQKLEALRERR